MTLRVLFVDLKITSVLFEQGNDNVSMFQASKVKGSQNASAVAPQAETAQQAKTDLPPVPKTPDAMDHMPEQMKTEYRRLKEQLAQREKTRQPLTSINQEKGRVIQQVNIFFFNYYFQEIILTFYLKPM